MMKKWLTTILFAAATAAFAGAAPAAAQAQPKAAKATAHKKAPARKAIKKPARKKVASANAKARIKEYDFLGDELEGDIGRPDHEDVMARVAAKHANLIKVRRDFVREIGKAAEDL